MSEELRDRAKRARIAAPLIGKTGGPEAALWGFLIFYVTCAIVTWFVYTRRGGLLHDVERRPPPAEPTGSPTPCMKRSSRGSAIPSPRGWCRRKS